VALFRSINDCWGTALALDALSQKKSNLGLHEKAIQLQEESLAIRQRLEDRQGIARSYYILGLLVLHIGRIEASEAYLRKSLSILHTLNNPALLSNPLSILGINLLFAGRFEECIASYEESWAIHKEIRLAPRAPDSQRWHDTCKNKFGPLSSGTDAGLYRSCQVSQDGS
jgi:tetratricopeptide (TPR) repeat protein